MNKDPRIKEIFDMHKDVFESFFHEPLSMFWDSESGFLMREFCTQMLDGDGFNIEKCNERYGTYAVAEIGFLMSAISLKWLKAVFALPEKSPEGESDGEDT